MAALEDEGIPAVTIAIDSHGHAAIKPQYIDTNHKPTIAEEFLPKDIVDQLKFGSSAETADSTNEPPQKRPKLKGRHKKRPIEKNPENRTKICPQILAERECSFGERCKYSHNVAEYIASKPTDLGDTCYLFNINGYCQYSYACRFASKHLTDDNKNIINEELHATMKNKKAILNILDKDVQRKLWKKKYDFGEADRIWKGMKKLQEGKDRQSSRAGFCKYQSKNIPTSGDNNYQKSTSETVDDSKKQCKDREIAAKLPEGTAASSCNISVPSHNSADKTLQQDVLNDQTTGELVSCSSENDVLKSGPDNDRDVGRDTQKKVLNLQDKLYLAPLTTVGNLPFRRICKQYGVDVTCGEMALCTNLLQGQQSEWALLKRHESEDIFGAQLCGSFPDVMTRSAQVITSSLDVDFIDINCGCPIDLIFKKGEGCALMGRPSRFETIVRSMTSIMNIPVTCKIRTGIYEDKNLAHTLLPRLRDWGVSLVTLHGRSREQRYTRLADWDYINECAQIASPMPLFGNGDILSYEDYNLHREQTGVAGAMVARGALIKPWIFTEIKEQRHWDISASERLDMLRDYANFGMEYWGSDQQGVTITRRFLLEWLSFLYRYIPVGILERLPQRINEKPPHYLGRNDLETMMASPNCADWVKISEMLLGPVPDNFTFLPKHKANAYQ